MRMFFTALLAVLAGVLGMWGLRMTYRYFSAIPWEALARRPEARKPMAPMTLPGRPAHPRLDYFGGDAMLRPAQGPYEAAAPRAAAPTRAAATREAAPSRAAAPQRAGKAPAPPVRRTAAKGGRRSVGSLLRMLGAGPGGAGESGAAAAPASGGFDSAPSPAPSSNEESQSSEEAEPGPAPAASGPARARTRRSVGAHGSLVLPEAPTQEAPEADGGD